MTVKYEDVKDFSLTKEEMDELFERSRFVLEALAKYDSRYIGNVSEKEAREMFPEMFNDN